MKITKIPAGVSGPHVDAFRPRGAVARTCAVCGSQYPPAVPNQRMCDDCRKKRAPGSFTGKTYARLIA